jgi:2-methylaconitate cis-trans-isomerase PrpF
MEAVLKQESGSKQPGVGCFLLRPAPDGLARPKKLVPMFRSSIWRRRFVPVAGTGSKHRRASTLTASLCTGVAARIAGTLVAEALAPGATKRETIRIGMASGILAVGAAVEQVGPNAWIAQRGSFFRTTRRLFAGRLYLQLL